jgi:hypothetical protein
MTRVPWAFIAVLVSAAAASAQTSSPWSAFPIASSLSFSSSAPGTASLPGTNGVPASLTGDAASTPLWAASPDSLADSASAPAPEPPPQGVYGVLPKGDREVSLGYTFVRFYEVPGAKEDANGLDVSGVYYIKPWIGADAEILGVFGTISGSDSHLFVGGVGPRLRWPSSRGLELWGHALAGFAYLSPQTPYGGTTAFGYELGGGVDLNTRRGRWAYRVEADALGTQFFGTYQLSPKISAGIVYKF